MSYKDKMKDLWVFSSFKIFSATVDETSSFQNEKNRVKLITKDRICFSNHKSSTFTLTNPNSEISKLTCKIKCGRKVFQCHAKETDLQFLINPRRNFQVKRIRTTHINSMKRKYFVWRNMLVMICYGMFTSVFFFLLFLMALLLSWLPNDWDLKD